MIPSGSFRVRHRKQGAVTGPDPKGQIILEVLKFAESSIKPHGEDAPDHAEYTAKGTEF